MTPVLWLVLGGGVLVGGSLGFLTGFWTATDAWACMARDAWRQIGRMEAQARYRDHLAQVAEGGQ